MCEPPPETTLYPQQRISGGAGGIQLRNVASAGRAERGNARKKARVIYTVRAGQANLQKARFVYQEENIGNVGAITHTSGHSNPIRYAAGYWYGCRLSIPGRTESVMEFHELLLVITEQLRNEGRIAYRILKRRFNLRDEDLEDIKADLIDAKGIARDEHDKVLCWLAPEPATSERTAPPSDPTLNQHGVALADDGERRQLTIMFCDLVGSTSLSEELDPEDLRDIIRQYQSTCMQVIHRHHGHIAQYLGDGLLVYFGYPTAHEDAPQRAVHAGLEIVAAMRNLAHPKRSTVSVRLGIHTGLAVVGTVGTHENAEVLALGETPNLAARLQGLAAPDTVAISSATYALLQGAFECASLGAQTLKGISTPVTVYVALRESTTNSRIERSIRRSLTPLVGRAPELQLLQRLWAHSENGFGQVVHLCGEPGIGKTRLVQAMREHVTHKDGSIVIEFRCSSFHRNSALHPIIESLEAFLEFEPNEAPQSKYAKLATVISRYRFPTRNTLALLAKLFSIPLPAGAAALTLSPQKQKIETLEVLAAWVIEETQGAPVLCVYEDLHWADPSTLELLVLVMARIASAKLLVILTFRTEFSPPWSPQTFMEWVVLGRLGPPHSEEIARRATQGATIPADALEQLVAKADGIPLYLEELTKSLLASGQLATINGQQGPAGSTREFSIPDSLQDSLMERLDRVTYGKKTLQLVAMLGREFSYEIIRAVSSADEADLQRDLAHFVEIEILLARKKGAQTKYSFKHALLQDMAYQSLLKRRRKQFHRTIAETLEQQFIAIRDTQPEMLAHHYGEAGLVIEAISYWQQAGQRAIERSANIEAINHLNTGLYLTSTLPEGPDRTRRELALTLTLAAPLAMTKGYAAQEVEQAYARALSLYRFLGAATEHFPVLLGLWRFYVVRARFSTARDLAEELLRIARTTGEAEHLLGAYNALGITLFYIGEFDTARAEAEKGMASYVAALHSPAQSPIFRAGQDPGIACRSHIAYVVWLAGHPDQAIAATRQALAVARTLSHTFSETYALIFASRIFMHVGNSEQAKECAELGLALATEHGFGLWAAHATIFLGASLVDIGQGDEGLAHMRKGLAAAEASGAELGLTFFLAVLADGYRRSDNIGEGFAAVDQGLERVMRTGERYWEAELYRVRGMLLVQDSVKKGAKGVRPRIISKRTSRLSSDVEYAQACFLKAIDIAHRQGAKSLELRACVGLGTLWQSLGRHDHAKCVVQKIVGSFTEGFATRDLLEARFLIEALTKGQTG